MTFLMFMMAAGWLFAIPIALHSAQTTAYRAGLWRAHDRLERDLADGVVPPVESAFMWLDICSAMIDDAPYTSAPLDRLRGKSRLRVHNRYTWEALPEFAQLEKDVGTMSQAAGVRLVEDATFIRAAFLHHLNFGSGTSVLWTAFRLILAGEGPLLNRARVIREGSRYLSHEGSAPFGVMSRGVLRATGDEHLAAVASQLERAIDTASVSGRAIGGCADSVQSNGWARGPQLGAAVTTIVLVAGLTGVRAPADRPSGEHASALVRPLGSRAIASHPQP